MVFPIENGDIPAIAMIAMPVLQPIFTQEAGLEWSSLKQAGVVLSFFCCGFLHEQMSKQEKNMKNCTLWASQILDKAGKR